MGSVGCCPKVYAGSMARTPKGRKQVAAVDLAAGSCGEMGAYGYLRHRPVWFCCDGRRSYGALWSGLPLSGQRGKRSGESVRSRRRGLVVGARPADGTSATRGTAAFRERRAAVETRRGTSSKQHAGIGKRTWNGQLGRASSPPAAAPPACAASTTDQSGY